MLPISTDMDKYQEEAHLLCKGEESFILGLCREVFPSIANHVRNNSGTDQEAEDLFQDALTATYQKIRDEKIVLRCSMKTFLFAISKKMWLYRLRSRGKQVLEQDLSSLDFVSDDDLEKTTEESERMSLYFKYFDELGDACKSVLTMYFRGVSMEEIASRHSYKSANYAKKKKFECKKRLVELIKNDPIYQDLIEVPVLKKADI